jgi:putative transcriptional regulator
LIGIRHVWNGKTSGHNRLFPIYSKSEQVYIPAHVIERLQRKSKMSNRDIGQEILAGIRETKAYKMGQGDLLSHTLKEPAAPQVIRAKLNLSQSAFAGLMGVSLRTVQDWEQGRRKPSGPAKALLRIAEQKPDVFLHLV